MSEGTDTGESKFTSGEMLKRMTPFRQWEFTADEVFKGTQHFFQRVGYQLELNPNIGSAQLSFRANRRAEGTTYEVVGVVRQSLDQVAEGYGKLMAAKAVLGETADYVIVLPPIGELALLNFFRGNKGEWYLKLHQEQFMVWLGNPERESMWCFVGSARDKLFYQYFALARMSLDAHFGALLLQQALLEEEE